MLKLPGMHVMASMFSYAEINLPHKINNYTSPNQILHTPGFDV